MSKIVSSFISNKYSSVETIIKKKGAAFFSNYCNCSDKIYEDNINDLSRLMDVINDMNILVENNNKLYIEIPQNFESKNEYPARTIDKSEPKIILISNNDQNGIKYKDYYINYDFCKIGELLLNSNDEIIFIESEKNYETILLLDYLSSFFSKKIIFILFSTKFKLSNIINNVLKSNDDVFIHLILLYLFFLDYKNYHMIEDNYNYFIKIGNGGRYFLYNLFIKNSNRNIAKKLMSLSARINKSVKLIHKQVATLISDFDNTLYIPSDNNNTKSELKKFMNNHFLCINTGRSWNSIKRMKPKIKFDYLIANNGSEIYNKNYELIYYITLDDYDKSILQEYRLDKKQIKKYIPKGITNKNEITSLLITEYDRKEYDNHITALTGSLKHSYLYCEYPYIKIVNKQINKYLGAKYLIDNNYIMGSNVFCIGDSDNDYEMLLNFQNSAIMCNSCKTIKELNLKEYKNIADYIKYILENI